MELKYKTVLSDYNYLVSEYGIHDDFCGAVCNTDMYIELLENPNEETAKKQLITIIKDMFYSKIECRYSYRAVRLEIRPDDKRGKTIERRYK